MSQGLHTRRQLRVVGQDKPEPSRPAYNFLMAAGAWIGYQLTQAANKLPDPSVTDVLIGLACTVFSIAALVLLYLERTGAL